MVRDAEHDLYLDLQTSDKRITELEEKREDLARENYGLMLWLHELTGISARAIRETARSRAAAKLDSEAGQEKGGSDNDSS